MRIHIIIPSRMASTRLPNKPLADICGKPMICHVVDRAMEAHMGDVTVACDDECIKQAVEAHGGHAVLTDPNLPSGSDRIWQGLQLLMAEGKPKPDVIINVQGDEPLLPPELICEAVTAMQNNPWADVVTFAHDIENEADLINPNLVKVVSAANGKAHYFSRCPIPHGAKTMKRHIGFYAYRYDALEKFVASPPSALELQEKLEQLRGLDIGLNYYLGMTDKEPVGVDTAEDLEHARKLMANRP